MKNKLFSLILLSFLTISLPSFALAVDEEPFDLEGFLNRVSDWVFWIVMTLAGIFIVWAGYMYMTASGDPEKLRKAQNQLVYSLVGVAIAALAKALISFVAKFVGIDIN